MNGAHALLATLQANGVDTCFANPGTSEMHLVAGLDDFADLRAVLCLFEGVATGAADGYARVSGRPASTLLHLGPGLANGWANLHNARRARSPVLNIVGDHATHHVEFDAPLQSDIGAVAGALDGWVRRTLHPEDVARDTASAIGAACGPPGRVATLILPADVSWGDVPNPPSAWPVASRETLAAPDVNALDEAVEVLRTKRTALFVGGSAVNARQLELATRVALGTSSMVLMETFPAITDRGSGVFEPERLVYLSEFALAQLADFEALILIGAHEPVGFFAYPGVASRLVAPGCDVLPLALPGTDTLAALEYLDDAVGMTTPLGHAFTAPGGASGDLDNRSLADAVASTLPEGIIVADESNTSVVNLWGATSQSPRHRWMTLTGGAIGMGLPLAVGAAVASGGRVLALESDGSMMYTLQALWTMARESLDVTVVGLSNRSYAILNLERQRVGVMTASSASQRLLDLDDPALDLHAIAKGMGVPSVRVSAAEELVRELRRSYATPGPMFIEAMLPKGLN